jgi:Flp pilus assembly protein TadD
MLNLATLMIFDGQEKEALPLLQHAVAIAPKNPKIHEQLGHVYLRLEELPAAQREFETAVALSPDHAAYHFLLGQVYRRQGEKEKAKVEFDRAAALDGTHSAEH